LQLADGVKATEGAPVNNTEIVLGLSLHWFAREAASTGSAHTICRTRRTSSLIILVHLDRGPLSLGHHFGKIRRPSFKLARSNNLNRGRAVASHTFPEARRIQSPPPKLNLRAYVFRDSAELSHSLKVLDRGRNTQEPVRNRSESVRAGVWAPPRAFGLGFVRVWGRFWFQIGNFRPDS
jgi:hypothetical protein